MRKKFIAFIFIFLVSLSVLTYFWSTALYIWIAASPFLLIAIVDLTQKKHAVRRNFPIIGHFRYILESVRPEIQQYFIETNKDGMPFSRETRSVIYQRAKEQLDTLAFGSQIDMNEPGYEWINHSLAPKKILKEEPKVLIGGATCSQPYLCSRFNIAGMSYGALSSNAVLALNKGAQMGGFAHNTGEGSISPYHLQGGDLVWQIGTGYFGCRTPEGEFCYEKFKEQSKKPEVKMIEIKLSQGAKPGHGGILPAKKITPEIAAIRGVPLGKDVISPPSHSAFSNPIQLMEWITQLRDASGGKPVGIKLSLGKRHEFLSMCKAMLETGIHPDFITIDGAEGGTGAAPVEFANYLGTPLNDALIFVHNVLVGVNLREKIRVIASGKITSGFNIAVKLSIGADLCYSARGMMFALGCIQALRCNANVCPTGLATHDPNLTEGLFVPDKAQRVANYHKHTVESFLEVLAATGHERPECLKPWYVWKRKGFGQVKNYADLFHYLQPGELLVEPVPQEYRGPWNSAHANSFS